MSFIIKIIEFLTACQSHSHGKKFFYGVSYHDKDPKISIILLSYFITEVFHLFSHMKICPITITYIYKYWQNTYIGRPYKYQNCEIKSEYQYWGLIEGLIQVIKTQMLYSIVTLFFITKLLIIVLWEFI